MTTCAILAVASISLVLYYIFFWEPRKVRYKTYEFSFRALPRSFDGFTILHLTDLHFRRRDSAKKKVLRSLAEEPVDLCLITGDFIESPDAIGICCEALTGLNAAHGVYGVLGNHDYYRYSYVDALRNRSITDRPNQSEELLRALSATGIKVLRNESVRVERNGEWIYVIGIDDGVTHRADMPLAVGSISKEEETLWILLCHTPDILKGARVAREFLLLAGHTHGGQVRIPLWGPVVNHSKLKDGFVSGSVRFGEGVVVVSSGVGVNGLFPFRWRCKPEVIRITLRRNEGRDARDKKKEPSRGFPASGCRAVGDGHEQQRD
jgi:predicted MPP superfamily phosphohydrolase